MFKVITYLNGCVDKKNDFGLFLLENTYCCPRKFYTYVQKCVGFHNTVKEFFTAQNMKFSVKNLFS